jgi:hypothetical protein
MRSNHSFRVLAAVASAVAIVPSAASAKFDNTTYPPLGPVKAAQPHSGGSEDWALIAALGGVGVVAIAGTGVVSSRRGRSVRARAGATSG